MASGQTANYNLNQWEAGDKVLRTEFNEDNARIDGILAEKLGRSELIKTVPTPVKYQYDLTLPLDDISWADWEYVIIAYNGRLSSTGAHLFATLNNAHLSSYCSTYTNTFTYHGSGPFFMVLFPMHSGDSPVQGICIADTSSFGIGAGTFSELTSICFHNSEYLPTDKIFTIWGVK